MIITRENQTENLISIINNEVKNNPLFTEVIARQDKAQWKKKKNCTIIDGKPPGKDVFLTLNIDPQNRSSRDIKYCPQKVKTVLTISDFFNNPEQFLRFKETLCIG